MKLARQLFLILAITILVAPLERGFAQRPVISRMENAGGQRGSEFTVRCVGEGFEGVDNVLFYESGLELKSIKSASDDSLELLLSSTADCRLGEHAIRIVNEDGIADLRTVHIGPYPHRPEEEPNNDVSRAQKTPLGVTVTGVVEEGDVDVFQISLEKGQRLSAETVALRLSNYLFDCYLAILDDKGNILVESDDTALLKQEPIVSFTAKEKGDYFLLVRESAFGGDLDSEYQLHIGSHPRPTVAYPAGGMRGDELTTTLIGDGSGTIVETLSLPHEAEATMEYYPEDGRLVAPSPIKFRVSDFPNVLEIEPNDSVDSPTLCRLKPSFAINGILSKKNDQDVFRFDLKAGDQFDVETFATRIGSPADTVVIVYGPNGLELLRNDDGVGHDSTFRLFAPEDGSYTLAVRDHLNRGGEDFVYRIELGPVTPKLELTVPKLSVRRPQKQQAIEIPQGGRFSMLVSARRTSASGPVELEFPDLPKGITANATPIEPGSHLTYVVFEAAKDAPLQSDLIRINGSLNDDNVGTVMGNLKQDVGLVFGPPRQTPYHSVQVDRIPIVVKKNSPYLLAVTPPIVPLVQDGVMSIQVHAKRAEGYDGPIRLTLPYMPPWLELPEDGIEIPSGKDATTFQLIATADAEPRAWSLAINGAMSVNGEDVYASTSKFDVEVTEPMVELTINPSKAEQGTETTVSCSLQWNNVSGDSVVAHLKGLPKGTNTQPMELQPGDKQLSFPVDVGEDAWAAVHNTLYVQLDVGLKGETVTHYLARKGVIEIFEKGKQAKETRSRFDILLDQKQQGSLAASKNKPASSTP